MEWRERDGLRWLEADLDGATVAFTTRVGGVSDPPFNSLNLGSLTEDTPEAVEENRGRLVEALGFAGDQIAFARQVHGAELATAAGQRCAFPVHSTGKAHRNPHDIRAADGQVVEEPGIAGLVFVADCLPVAVHGPGGVAMLHCGWRGLAGGIVAKGVEAVGATGAAIGPGIGPCCYEVGDDVLVAFTSLGQGIASTPSVESQGNGSPGSHLDLPEVARRLLAEAGVMRVESAGLCTYCEADLFFSHRRDAGHTGRQAGLAWLGDPPQSRGAAH
jgi:polyphenol oxidase